MKILYTLLSLLTFGTIAIAQPYMGLHFIGSSPLNTFHDSAYRNGYGFNLEFLSNNVLRSAGKPNALDLRFGIAFDVQGAGKEEFDVTLNTPENDPGTLRISNTHAALRGLMRMSFLSEKRVSPYVDLFVGRRVFYSSQTLSFDEPRDDYESTETSQLLSGGTWRYGASYGMQYRLNSVFSVDTRITYSKGTATNWLLLNSLTPETIPDRYRTPYTTTDLFMYHVGIVIRFNKPDRSRSGGSNSDSNNNNNNENGGNDAPAPEKKPKRRVTTTPSQPGNEPPKKPIEIKPTPQPKPKPAS